MIKSSTSIVQYKKIKRTYRKVKIKSVVISLGLI